uniref:Secreted protein n=1 Tax=Cacopsylla melanoneura TaxID=428564 RepID=A0A8D9BDB8_9HEMI
MFSKNIIQLYLLLTLIHNITAAIEWTSIDVAANQFDGIKAYLGKDLCAGDKKMCTENFTNYVKTEGPGRMPIPEIKDPSIGGSCETDKDVNNTVCWVRIKKNPGVFNSGHLEVFGTHRTKFEIQFWLDKNKKNETNCRYAKPT